MSMTRKDYVAIAAALKAAQVDSGINNPTWTATPSRLQGIRHAATRLADMMSQANPRFDRSRFMREAGFDDWEDMGDDGKIQARTKGPSGEVYVYLGPASDHGVGNKKV